MSGEQVWSFTTERQLAREMAEEDAERQEQQRTELAARQWLEERQTVLGPDEFRSYAEVAESLGWIAVEA